jgi:TetR/AcrR family transcriptional repressor of nem operon
MSTAAKSSARGRAQPASTASRILDVAERLVQERGFNGFSYADVASELGITKASLHYHYAGKAELGEALIWRYSERFVSGLEAIEADQSDASDKLAAYAALHADVLRGRRMCLCGMLAAEYQTLPRPIRDAVITFFDDNESWLERVLEQGRDSGSLSFAGSSRETAQMIISALEGAMLVARPYGDLDRFRAASDRLLGMLATTS